MYAIRSYYGIPVQDPLQIAIRDRRVARVPLPLVNGIGHIREILRLVLVDDDVAERVLGALEQP